MADDESRRLLIAVGLVSVSEMVMSKALKAVALVVALIQASEAFVISPMAAARAGVVMQGGRKATPLGRTSTQEGKKVSPKSGSFAQQRARLFLSLCRPTSTLVTCLKKLRCSLSFSAQGGRDRGCSEQGRSPFFGQL